MFTARLLLYAAKTLSKREFEQPLLTKVCFRRSMAWLRLTSEQILRVLCIIARSVFSLYRRGHSLFALMKIPESVGFLQRFVTKLPSSESTFTSRKLMYIIKKNNCKCVHDTRVPMKYFSKSSYKSTLIFTQCYAEVLVIINI